MTMEEDALSLEEGELSDDSVSYTPLERPANYSSAGQPSARFPVNQDSESESELQSTDSDSDSDTNKKKRKKPKIKLKPKWQDQNCRRKKYDIWSTRVQEDVLAETLNSCDVTKKDRSRDVETYDYLGNQFYNRTNNKRSRDDRKNANLRSVGGSKNVERHKGNARTILDLAVNTESSSEEIARDVANKLYEEKEDLILRVVNSLGKEKTFSLFKETKNIEQEGGMLIMNQTRRRTPGGVFLFLIRQDTDITAEQKNIIFSDERERYKVHMKNKHKKKLKKLKADVAAAKSKLLPDLLTRAELLAKETCRKLKETDDRDVINPPPTPETDCHDNSGDGMDGLSVAPVINGDIQGDQDRRKLQSYDDDFLDIGCSNDMDLF